MIGNIPAGIYLLKVNNRNTRASSEICSKLTIKTPVRRQWRRSDVFIVNFEHISQLTLVLLLLTLNMQLPAGIRNVDLKNSVVFIVDFELIQNIDLMFLFFTLKSK